MTYPLRLPPHEPVLTITHSPSIWIIELHHGEDNRLTENFILNAILPALDHVELAWRNALRESKAKKDDKGGKGALVITGKRSQNKFFSNGFDYPAVIANPGFIPTTYNRLLKRLLTFPIPTVAAINGHVFAAGFVTAMACDYRVIVSDKERRVWGCMNEVHFGAALPNSFAELFNVKVTGPQTLRKLLLEGHRFTPSELFAANLVDDVVDGNTEAVLQRACALAENLSENARTGVWGLIKKGINRAMLERVDLDLRTPNAAEDDAVARARL